MKNFYLPFGCTSPSMVRKTGCAIRANFHRYLFFKMTFSFRVVSYFDGRRFVFQHGSFGIFRSSASTFGCCHFNITGLPEVLVKVNSVVTGTPCLIFPNECFTSLKVTGASCAKLTLAKAIKR